MTVSDLGWPRLSTGCVTNLLLYLDCQADVYSDTNGTPSNNGDPVVEWRSQVGGYKFQQLGTSTPSRDVSGNNIVFNTASLTNLQFAVSQPFTVIIAHSIEALPGTNIILSSAIGLNLNNYNDAISVMRPGIYAGTDLSTPDEDILTAYQRGMVVSAVYDGANSFIRTNMTTAVTGSAGTLGASGMKIGETNFFGSVWEIRVYSCVLPTNTLYDIETNIIARQNL